MDPRHHRSRRHASRHGLRTPSASSAAIAPILYRPPPRGPMACCGMTQPSGLTSSAESLASAHARPFRMALAVLALATLGALGGLAASFASDSA